MATSSKVWQPTPDTGNLPADSNPQDFLGGGVNVKQLHEFIRADVLDHVRTAGSTPAKVSPPIEIQSAIKRRHRRWYLIPPSLASSGVLQSTRHCEIAASSIAVCFRSPMRRFLPVCGAT